MITKLAPYLIVLSIFVSAFFYGVYFGKKSEKSKYQAIIIKDADKNVEIEQKQSKHISNRDKYDLSKRLRNGSF